MKEFLKENLVMIAGIALPLIVALIFFASIQIGKINIDPPQYKVLFLSGNYYNNPYTVRIKNSQAFFKYTEPKNNNHDYNRPALYVYDPSKNASIEIDLPKLNDDLAQDEKIITFLKDEKITSNSTSPDGYRFEQNYHRNGNLITEIFGGGYRSRSSYVLKKKQNIVKVPNAPRYHTKFVGWIVTD